MPGLLARLRGETYDDEDRKESKSKSKAGAFKRFVRAGRSEEDVMAAMRRTQQAAFGKPTNRAPKAERSTSYTPPSTSAQAGSGSRPKSGSQRSRSYAKPTPKPRELEAGTGRTARQTRGAVEAGTGRHARKADEPKESVPKPRARPKAPRLSGLVVSPGFDERKKPRPKPKKQQSSEQARPTGQEAWRPGRTGVAGQTSRRDTPRPKPSSRPVTPRVKPDKPPKAARPTGQEAWRPGRTGVAGQVAPRNTPRERPKRRKPSYGR